ncbi:hypothetical protein BU24DRAFT_76259 [Aaosphaeria arxii CBS 175.79]|uniref:Secreted protein n=1 Tax=Aaosphaeria arxii CBS 175.79 TaxID=1450172 RepID=A0A6A5X990_9PLEO|nr:uncharacterized protein BU24DRAFT_76259 [Aaosphaeria arxii CBS 175.79]KAF2009511.1 hypothetical protein BU24DRAFT_76259 [Aaosphaeria arxii CBS 175.79]
MAAFFFCVLVGRYIGRCGGERAPPRGRGVGTHPRARSFTGIVLYLYREKTRTPSPFPRVQSCSVRGCRRRPFTVEYRSRFIIYDHHGAGTSYLG